jgi:hypothetical protein
MFVVPKRIALQMSSCIDSGTQLFENWICFWNVVIYNYLEFRTMVIVLNTNDSEPFRYHLPY